MSYFFIFLIIITPAFATLDNIQIKNFDFNYVSPEGHGEVEKVSIGIKLREETYPVEIFRRDQSLDVLSPFVDFQWVNPIEFFHNMKSASARKLNLKVDRKNHFLRGESVKIAGETTEDLAFENFDLNCSGQSVAVDPAERIKSDCLENMEATISHIELPLTFVLAIASELPDVSGESENDVPANDFSLSMSQGDFFSHMKIKLGVRAYLKLWGHAQFEQEGKVLAIRMDTIRFGILPVTDLVMGLLSRQIQNPKVTVIPPWIRIQLGKQ